MPPIPIEKAIQRLLYWISPTGYGFARVEFKLPLTQREAWSRLQSRLQPILAERGMTTSEVIFPTPINPARLAVQLRDQLQAAPPGVISVPWSLSWFPNEAALAETLGHLNFLRDGLALPHLHQIWWMETAFADRFIPSIPDLESWFTLRLELEDLPLPQTGMIWQTAADPPPGDPRQARKTAQMLAGRAHNAINKGAPPERVWSELLAPARKLLLEATLAAEAAALALEFPSFSALLLEQNDPSSVRQQAEQELVHAEGDLTAARALSERALQIDEATFGPHHPNVATRASGLAQILKAEGDLAGARALSERALAINEATFGPHHPKVATDASNLATILKAQGDLPQARTLTERALAIDEAAFDPHHPNLAIRAGNLAQILKAQGDLPQARALTERALAIALATYGPENPTTKTYAAHLEALVAKA